MSSTLQIIIVFHKSAHQADAPDIQPGAYSHDRTPDKVAYEIKCRQCGSIVSGTAINCPKCHLVVGVDQRTASATPSSLLPLCARLLAYFSLVFALFVFSAVRLGFEPFSFEATLVLAGLCIWLCILAAAASIIASAILWLKDRGVGPVPSLLSLIALGVVCASIYWPG
jgi:hypothetical protein